MAKPAKNRLQARLLQISCTVVHCHICGRSANLTNFVSPQVVCGFVICGTYLRTAHLWLFPKLNKSLAQRSYEKYKACYHFNSRLWCFLPKELGEYSLPWILDSYQGWTRWNTFMSGFRKWRRIASFSVCSVYAGRFFTYCRVFQNNRYHHYIYVTEEKTLFETKLLKSRYKYHARAPYTDWHILLLQNILSLRVDYICTARGGLNTLSLPITAQAAFLYLCQNT